MRDSKQVNMGLCFLFVTVLNICIRVACKHFWISFTAKVIYQTCCYWYWYSSARSMLEPFFIGKELLHRINIHSIDWFPELFHWDYSLHIRMQCSFQITPFIGWTLYHLWDSRTYLSMSLFIKMRIRILTSLFKNQCSWTFWFRTNKTYL